MWASRVQFPMILYLVMNLRRKFLQSMLRYLSLSPTIQKSAHATKVMGIEHFQTKELETTYIHKATKKSRADRLIMCSRCSWTTTDTVLQGSSGNLGTHLRKQHKIFKPGTSIPLSTVVILTILKHTIANKLIHG
ncbi:hypothetical protein V1523DRAFT_127312 [Lipomyces doorenjongii]